jgi:hypothetical protein
LSAFFFVERHVSAITASKPRQLLTQCLPGPKLDSAKNEMCLISLAHPTRFERVTFAFGGQRSIQLSYGCVRVHLADWPEVGNGQTGAVLGQQQGSKGRGQAFEPCRARKKHDPRLLGNVKFCFGFVTSTNRIIEAHPCAGIRAGIVDLC